VGAENGECRFPSQAVSNVGVARQGAGTQLDTILRPPATVRLIAAYMTSSIQTRQDEVRFECECVWCHLRYI